MNILGQQYRILLCKEITSDNHESLEGECDTEEHVIRVVRDLPKHRQYQVLLHEVIHALADRLKLQNVGISADIEEILCETIAITVAENFEMELKVGKE